MHGIPLIFGCHSNCCWFRKGLIGCQGTLLGSFISHGRIQDVSFETCDSLIKPIYIYANHTHYRYGYATNTRVKFIIITENTASISRDQEIAQVQSFI